MCFHAMHARGSMYSLLGYMPIVGQEWQTFLTHLPLICVTLTPFCDTLAPFYDTLAPVSYMLIHVVLVTLTALFTPDIIATASLNGYQPKTSTGRSQMCITTGPEHMFCTASIPCIHSIWFHKRFCAKRKKRTFQTSVQQAVLVRGG